MSKADKHFFAFSSFPPAMIWEKRNRSLLIQFLITELLSAYRGVTRNAPPQEILSSEKCFFPYDWACPYGRINKAREYTMALEYVFPELARPSIQLLRLLSKNAASPKMTAKWQKSLPEIFFGLEPFIERCKENENLIFFLLKHKEDIEECLHNKDYLHAMLLKLHPNGLFELCEKLCDNFHHRGFYFLIPEIKRLMAQFIS